MVGSAIDVSEVKPSLNAVAEAELAVFGCNFLKKRISQ
jgi:hypothetical protein